MKRLIIRSVVLVLIVGLSIIEVTLLGAPALVHSPKAERAYQNWESNPTPQNTAAWLEQKEALDRSRREGYELKYLICGVGAIGIVWLTWRLIKDFSSGDSSHQTS